MRTVFVVAVTLAVLCESVRAQSSVNFIDTIKLPVEKQDGMTRKAVAQFATTLVPTARDADRVVLTSVIRKTGLDARDGTRVTGLFFIGRSAPSFANKGDLVWEVGVYRGEGLMQMMWVSTTTKEVWVLFNGQSERR